MTLILIRQCSDRHKHCMNKHSPFIHLDERRPVQRRCGGAMQRALTQKCTAKKLNQAQLLLRCNVSLGQVLCLPIKYMQAHIAGRLLWNEDAIFLLFVTVVMVVWSSKIQSSVSIQTTVQHFGICQASKVQDLSISNWTSLIIFICVLYQHVIRHFSALPEETEPHQACFFQSECPLNGGRWMDGCWLTIKHFGPEQDSTASIVQIG